MVFLFGGIDFPLYELLFVVSILLLVGLVMVIIGVLSIIKELKHLKSLLTEEETDIKQFEKDISELEVFEGKRNLASDDIKGYIKDNLKEGFNWDQIKKSLVEQGWKEKVLEDIYKQVNK